MFNQISEQWTTKQYNIAVKWKFQLYDGLIRPKPVAKVGKQKRDSASRTNWSKNMTRSCHNGWHTLDTHPISSAASPGFPISD
jgi:hypothetical protein